MDAAGMASGAGVLRAPAISKRYQGLAVRPLEIGVFALEHGAHPCLRLADRFANTGLGKSQILKFFNECFPVHGCIITNVVLIVNTFMIFIYGTLLKW